MDKRIKDIALKNRLDWVTSHSTVSESERIWPLKSVMNPVWQKLNLGMVSESMRVSLTPSAKKKGHLGGSLPGDRYVGLQDVDLPFADSIWKWFGRFVASQKRR